MLAAAGSIAAAAIGVVQFLNPTAHWYCTLFSVSIACWMSWVSRERAARLVGAGFLVEGLHTAQRAGRLTRRSQCGVRGWLAGGAAGRGTEGPISARGVETRPLSGVLLTTTNICSSNGFMSCELSVAAAMTLV